ncbi:MAG: response regulator transcription factor, partial [Sphingobacterium sp.]
MQTKQRILLVEDEEHLLEAIKLNLELEGYRVTTAVDGKMALKRFKEERFNLVVLDVMIPEIDGFQVAETIRLQNTEVPIMFLTAKNSSEDRITGLKKGADDYLVKPFNLEELILRVGNLIRRGLKSDDLKEFNSYTIGDKTIYFNSFELHHSDGTITSLTKKETML